MDSIWEARQKEVDEFCEENNINKSSSSDIQEVIYDEQYGKVGRISNFICILPDGTKMIEWP